MVDDLYKFPRLYVPADLAGSDIALDDAQAHYLRNVMRRADGDVVRLFNGRDGEWLANLVFTGKRDVSVRLDKQVKVQAPRIRRVHLLFAPLKKDRMDTLIEKAVELDATDLHPVITDRTEVREVKADKINAHIIEAAEQCERMDIPTLHPLASLEKVLAGWKGSPIFAGLERSDAQILRDALVPDGDCAALVGPAGGWTNDERDMLAQSPAITPVSLGNNVLRSETAVAALLVRLSR